MKLLFKSHKVCQPSFVHTRVHIEQQRKTTAAFFRRLETPQRDSDEAALPHKRDSISYPLKPSVRLVARLIASICVPAGVQKLQPPPPSPPSPHPNREWMQGVQRGQRRPRSRRLPQHVTMQRKTFTPHFLCPHGALMGF